jgi:Arc/MetJ-type ribon-helix-helix transcriptional regulator
MDYDLTPEQHSFIRDAIGSGRIEWEEDAVREALALWEDRDRRRAELLATLDDAMASLTAAKGFPSHKSPCASWPVISSGAESNV